MSGVQISVNIEVYIYIVIKNNNVVTGVIVILYTNSITINEDRKIFRLLFINARVLIILDFPESRRRPVAHED